MIVILDGNSIAYRAYHKSPPLSSPDGRPTGTVHIFFTILEKVRREVMPSSILAVFDSKGETVRHEMFPEYKANRDAMPEELSIQLEIIKELLPLAGIDVYAKPGLEADDIIASLAKKNSDNGVVIVTKDKDLFQLVDNNIKIYDDASGKLLGIDDTKIKYGVFPSQILSYLSLIGDKSDNIPGVTGVGEKTAAKLIQEYNTLDGVYENIDSFKGKLKENLIKDKENAYRAMSLIKLQAPEIFDPVSGENKEVLKQELEKLGMRAVAAKLLSEGTEPGSFIPAQIKPCILAEVKKPTFIISLDQMVYVTDGNKYESYDPARHNYKDIKDFYDIKEFYKEVEGTYQGGKEINDYLLISWICEPDTGTIKKSKNEPLEEFIPRLLSQSSLLLKKLDSLNLKKLYTDVELKVAFILGDMELFGIKINPARVEEISAELKKRIDTVANRLITTAGYGINLNSPKQLSEFLYDKLMIKPLTKSNRSTAEEVLRELVNTTPEYKDILESILEYRVYAKLLSTYTKPLIDAINPSDGRVHTTFRQTGTGTGRLSSVAPNLQNIPVRGDLGGTIRSAFVPREGYIFISADYSQIELRILAHISKDEALVEAFKSGKDIHNITAMNIFGLNESDVTPDHRRLAKAVNFGIIYGLSAYGLSRDVGIAPKDAKTFIDAYFTLYKGVKNYISDVVSYTREHGYCETVLGRKRFFPDIDSRNALNRQRAERAAMNAPLQGSAADIIKLAMIACNELIKDFDGGVCLQIHDELLVEVKESQSDSFMKALKPVMENVFKLSVPLSVNISKAHSWGGL